MDRRQFIRTTCQALAGASVLGHAAAAERPNIVLILADDLGWEDLGVQGCRDVPTPHIDSIARAGLRFTNAYVSCPVCSPTRAGLMTGRYQQRFGFELNPGRDAGDKFGLPLDEVTLANRLKALGYATGIVGKWHLGSRPGYLPQKRGFDEFYGFLDGQHVYVPPDEKRNPLLRGTEPAPPEEYLTNALAREAVSFIDRHQKGPYFLYLPFNAVHKPLQALDRDVARFPAIQDKKRRAYAAMLASMDDAVGQVLRMVRESGAEEKTLILFTSDNGGPTPITTSRNGPLRGYKYDVLEGGIRVPFLMQWKGRLAAGKVDDRMVSTLDIVPTVVAAAGSTPAGRAKLDGVNLLPYAAGTAKGAPHDRLFWRFGPKWAVRVGDWKLLTQGTQEELYNLARDVGEKQNLAPDNPGKVRELRAVFDAWSKQMMAPKWIGPTEQGEG